MVDYNCDYMMLWSGAMMIDQVRLDSESIQSSF